MQSKLCFTGCQLICSGIVNANVNLSCNFLFITGTVYTPQGSPMPNAAIEIRILDASDPSRVIRVGVTFSLSDGTYGVTLPKIPGRQYELLAYSHL
ncbi:MULTISPECIES: carboxypeptidase regulatory-like domain-containing protein [Lacrimispora]|uniref:carboxypeptidase regulatory-like domain-containing protein n=1 Tax=Lacrimispora TaxID=2719231 RepID=UPI0011419698|nr:carboxypeptidase regulatory-like domain-containing protein [Lacrimispora amygdalina]MDK2967532.1 hypothetical protein [Lacrimispora sp.]